jgi:hypothetical protein
MEDEQVVGGGGWVAAVQSASPSTQFSPTTSLDRSGDLASHFLSSMEVSGALCRKPQFTTKFDGPVPGAIRLDNFCLARILFSMNLGEKLESFVREQVKRRLSDDQWGRP